MSTLVEDARALLTATADVAGDKINQARQRLSTALGDGRDMMDRCRSKAGEGAQAAKDVVRQHPYQAIALGFGLGALIAYLAGRRGS